MSWYQGCEAFVREQVLLADLTSYRVGGPAEFYAEPPDEEALCRVLKNAAAANLQVRVLGRGTNLLVADAGVKGLVIHLPKTAFGAFECREQVVHAGAALGLPVLIHSSISQGLTGLECLQGIPGSVGAALRMNAGGKYGQIANRVRRVFGVSLDGTPFEAGPAKCGFVYRGSKLHDCVVTNCDLELVPGNKVTSRILLTQITSEKVKSQPYNARSAGCVFKNPPKTNFPPAGKLIEGLGLKLLRVGGASVSAVHANFLICEGDAKARDLVQLIRLVRQRVYEEHEVLLELEIETWGIEAAELLPLGCT